MSQCAKEYWTDPQMQCFCVEDEGHDGPHVFELGEDGKIYASDEHCDDRNFWVAKVHDLMAQLTEAQTLAAAKQDAGMVCVPREFNKKIDYAIREELRKVRECGSERHFFIASQRVYQAMLSAAAEGGG